MAADGLPGPGLLKSVLLYGERSNADQVSEANAKTPFQIIPATRKAVLDKYGVDAYLSPQNAAEAAGLLLKESLQRNKGDIKLAAAEYHGGTNPKNWGPRTKSYIERVSAGVGLEQAATPATLPGGGDSTFQRVMAARGGAGAVAGGGVDPDRVAARRAARGLAIQRDRERRAEFALRTAGTDRHLPYPVGQHHINQRPGEWLFIHMRMHQLPGCDHLTVKIQNLPLIGEMIPAGIGMAQCHINPPAQIGPVRHGLFDHRGIGKDRGGQTGKDDG
jgi:hypothetical protein